MRKHILMTALCLLLCAVMTGCTANADQRTGEAEGYGGTLRVTVTMNGDDITAVKVIEHHETEGVGTRAIDALPAAIEKADSIDVDGVSGATVTSNAIKEAVSQAMGMAGLIQKVIPMDDANASEAPGMTALTGAGMAATGRVGPGKDEGGNQVYSVNVVFAAGVFEEDGRIRSMKVDQLEVVSPNLGAGSTFSGFPASSEGEEAFLSEVSAWSSKGAQGDSYMLTSGSWREQMDAYERQMVGKTVEEVKEWYAARGNSSASDSETLVTDASDGGTAQPGAAQGADAAPGDGMAANAAQADATTGATMSLQSEYGDILLAIERSWEDAQRGRSGSESSPRVDTNTLTDATDGEANVG